MYSIILGIGAYTLLLFSFITIVVLLKRQFKQWTYTSIYILSVSDVLFSILTAGILFINYMEIDVDILDVIFSNNNTWYGKDQKDNFIAFHKILKNITMQKNFNTSHECNVMHIILHYGMFLIPFTNSFMSLLMFSVQCNLNAFNLKNQCYKSCQLQKSIEEDNKVNESDSLSKEKCETIECKESEFDLKPTLIQCYKTKLLEVIQYNKIKSDNKMIVTIFVINQWITPIAVTGLLHSILYENVSFIKNTENARCFGNYFLFGDYHNSAKVVNTGQNYSSFYAIPLHKNYINNIELSNTSNIQVNEIISKVHGIVHSALDNTNNTSHYISHIEPYNTTKLFNMMEATELNTHTEIWKNNDDMNVNSSKSSISGIMAVEYESAFNLTNPYNINLLSNIQSDNNTGEYDKEEQLYNYLMTNTSENNSVEEDNSDNEIIISANRTLIFNRPQTNNVETIDKIVESTTRNNVSVVTNDQIYSEILKRIHNAVHYTMKNNYNQQNKKKQPKQRVVEQDFNYNSIMNKSNLSSVIQFITYKTNNALNETSIYVMDIYWIPVQFLKLYLLLLLFVIYFLPILFCTILHQRGKLNCQLVLDKLKAKNEMLSNTSNKSLIINYIDNTSPKEFVDSKEASTSKQDSIDSKESKKKVKTNVSSLNEIEIFNENSTERQNEQQESKEFDKRRMELNMIVHMKNSIKLLDTVKMSLFCGTILWTPILFEVISKIFAQVSIPEWLFNITYLIAVMFSIIRNLFNLKMIKLQDISANITKTNSIHPII